MFTFHIDLGQIIIAGLIAIVAWFVKRLVIRTEKRIDRIEDVIFSLNGDMQTVIGHLGIERRKVTLREG